jgi:adenosyl cobinamide kinase/adenosyl cobinamide phosphate guanylyltransferase
VAELVTGPHGATVDGVLHLSPDGHVTIEGYQVQTTRTPNGLRYDVRTPAGDELSWTAPPTTPQSTPQTRPQIMPATVARRTLILGGARSGKSTEAERLLADHPDTLYVATGYSPSAPDAYDRRSAQVGRSAQDQQDRRSTQDQQDRRSTQDQQDRRSTQDQQDRRSTQDQQDRRSTQDQQDGRSEQDEQDDQAGDAEWAERIARHRARRPSTWGLAETIDLVPLLRADGPPLLIDCLTLWLSRTMDACEVWTEPARAAEVETRIDDLAAAWSATPRLVVAVSNEVGSGIVPATASGRLFRDLMGRVNTAIAHHSDTVLWCVAGRITPL